MYSRRCRLEKVGKPWVVPHHDETMLFCPLQPRTWPSLTHGQPTERARSPTTATILPESVSRRTAILHAPQQADLPTLPKPTSTGSTQPPR